MSDETIKINPELSGQASLTASAEPAEPKQKKQPGFDLARLWGRPRKSPGDFHFARLAKYIFSLTIAVIVAVLAWVMFFLYNNVYLTMTQAEIVSSLKSKVIEESVDYGRFNKILEKINWKKELADWPYLDYLTSPFAFGPRTPYPISTLPPAAASSTSIRTATSSAPASTTDDAKND